MRIINVIRTTREEWIKIHAMHPFFTFTLHIRFHHHRRHHFRRPSKLKYSTIMYVLLVIVSNVFIYLAGKVLLKFNRMPRNISTYFSILKSTQNYQYNQCT